jgi:predicted nucleic acid-binding protein
VISGPVVIDASVVVEYLIDLGLIREARVLFGHLLDPDGRFQLWAPDLIFPESLSALRKLVTRRSIDARAGERAVSYLTRLPISATGTAGLVREAWDLRGAITVYDACYVVLARRLRAPLVTADRKLARAMSRRADVVLLSEVRE